MDIKLKNRLILIVIILLFIFGIKGTMTGFHLLKNETQFLKNDYYQTMQFEQQLTDFIDHLSVFELSEVTRETAKEEMTVTSEEIEEHRFRYGNLADQIENIKWQYEDKIQKADQDLASLYIAERDKKIKDITENFSDDDHVKAKIIKEKQKKLDDYFDNLESYRSSYVRLKQMFKYYLTEADTGKVYTNVHLEDDQTIQDVMNQENMSYIHSFPSVEFGDIIVNENAFQRFDYFDEEGLVINNQKIFNGLIAVNRSEGNLILDNVKKYREKRVVLAIHIFLSFVSLLLSVYFYRKTKVHNAITIEKWRPYYNRIPLDIRIIVFVITTMILFALLTSNNLYYFYNQPINYFIEELMQIIIFSSLLLFLSFVQAKFLTEKMREIESLKKEWQKSVIYSFYNIIKRIITEFFLIKSLAVQTFIIVSLLGVSYVVIFVVALGEPYAVPPVMLTLAIPLFIIFIYIFRKIAFLNVIIKNVSEIANGHLGADLPAKGESVLANLASNINTLKRGVKTSQREQAKSERLKTELITNVSHDLRTPLTSIITYTELLKGIDVSSKERDSYLEIIDRKSKRLKVLIDDLFEASKMASGNIDLVKEKVDIVQLLEQALAEYNETIDQSRLQFRVTKPEIPVYAEVDGQKMWRVFDNLIGNILKYSLENTRVYISIKQLQSTVTITFKNVTKYELGENIDELFERFKRGDTSRHTDGSGLGLAIAKSIVELHDGHLEIDLDGDLFKVTIKF